MSERFHGRVRDKLRNVKARTRLCNSNNDAAKLLMRLLIGRDHNGIGRDGFSIVKEISTLHKCFLTVANVNICNVKGATSETFQLMENIQLSSWHIFTLIARRKYRFRPLKHVNLQNIISFRFSSADTI